MRHLVHVLLLAGLPALTLAVVLLAVGRHGVARPGTGERLDRFALAAGFRVPVSGRLEDRPRSARRTSAGAALVTAAATATAAAGTIHAVVTPEHFDEWWASGVFFLLAAILQLTWAGLILVRANGWVLILGLAGNAGAVALWLLTRTVGLPVGPEAGAAERVGLVDTVATTYEIVAVLLIALLGRGDLPRRVRLGSAEALAASALLGATLALALITHEPN